MLDIVVYVIAFLVFVVFGVMWEDEGWSRAVRNTLIASVLLFCIPLSLNTFSSYNTINVTIDKYDEKVDIGATTIEFGESGYRADIEISKPQCWLTAKRIHMVDSNYNNLRARIDQLIKKYPTLSHVEWKDKTVSEKISLQMKLN
jgi:hypothetical protein